MNPKTHKEQLPYCERSEDSKFLFDHEGHGFGQCPRWRRLSTRRHKYMFAARGKVEYLVCLIVMMFSKWELHLVQGQAMSSQNWASVGRWCSCSVAYWFRLLSRIYNRCQLASGQTYTIFQALALGLTWHQNEWVWLNISTTAVAKIFSGFVW